MLYPDFDKDFFLEFIGFEPTPEDMDILKNEIKNNTDDNWDNVYKNTKIKIERLNRCKKTLPGLFKGGDRM